MAKMASKSVRLERVKKGVAASPKRFKGTRSAEIAKPKVSTSGAALNGGSSRPRGASDSINIKERQRQERAIGIRRGGK